MGRGCDAAGGTSLPHWAALVCVSVEREHLGTHAAFWVLSTRGFSRAHRRLNAAP